MTDSGTNPHTTTSPSDADSRYDAGIRVRREVMGDDFVDAALGRAAGTDGEELQEHVTATVWGSVWTRPGLNRRDRSLLNIGMLVALRATEELRGHVRGALTNGLTREEITEAIIHSSGYCGAPAALSAMKVAQQVLEEELGPRESSTESGA
ncbi:carboxymuconolactone decarboxylase family protein [Corynebacterium sp. P3-F1]|uniref:carboxymuconolactone decarboxylase family protein n=1 Tax=Corynebacterium sp. P3-F1 TaxID=3059080 RepID=UPI00265D0304|nr:carboxymuconolactone decarboxylase family protein [Corynebacterium sp. P3-F1]WKK61423.1 carboxymuconolactone decarboxylase family protein [Corynebacterium sp. P3-F1]